VDLSGFGTVIFTSGFRPDYAGWVRFPDAFDDMGFPIYQDGSSTVVRGLHFMGVHFQRKRKSATFLGVAEDAPACWRPFQRPFASRSRPLSREGHGMSRRCNFTPQPC